MNKKYSAVHDGMNTHGRVDIDFHEILTSALGRGDWFSSRPVCSSPVRTAGYTACLSRRMAVKREQHIILRPNIEPVTNHYTFPDILVAKLNFTEWLLMSMVYILCLSVDIQWNLSNPNLQYLTYHHKKELTPQKLLI
jgi:hypothetical protein